MVPLREITNFYNCTQLHPLRYPRVGMVTTYISCFIRLMTYSGEPNAISTFGMLELSKDGVVLASKKLLPSVKAYIVISFKKLIASEGEIPMV